MIEELAEHGDDLNASQLFRRFHRLQKGGHLRRTEKVVEGKQRKHRRITQQGRAYLKEQGRRLMELISEALAVDALTCARAHRKERERAKGRSA